MARKIRVLIVDDSASVRQALTAILAADPGIQVVGAANDPFAAARYIKDEVPDVVMLDVEMPRMDGITFLRKLMVQCPLPVVMCSSLTGPGSAVLMDALEAGAVDVISKPALGVTDFLEAAHIEIRDAVRGAAAAKVRPRRPQPPPLAGARRLTADAVLPPPSGRAILRTTETLACVGASTGGTEALREVLQALPADAPAIVAVQHMPEHFTRAFAKRLDGLCRVAVREAADGDQLLRGHVFIAPGGRHTTIERRGARYHLAVRDGPLVSRHRPSVDVLFRSAAVNAGANAIGIIMTGMGDDGARGLREMRDAGAMTIAQDEETSTVFGMPKEAIAHGGVERVVPLDSIAAALLDCTRAMGRGGAADVGALMPPARAGGRS